jgi:hypothetical protein
MSLKAIVWCENCLFEYEIVAKTDIENEDEFTPKVCPFCKDEVTDYFFDEVDDDLDT